MNLMKESEIKSQVEQEQYDEQEKDIFVRIYRELQKLNAK